jgi:membrane protein implicated in regulation of membrane protease activity
MALSWFLGQGGASWLSFPGPIWRFGYLQPEYVSKREEAIMEFLVELGAWSWLILALVLVILETLIPGIHFVWFGMAATVVGVLALATGMDWQWQLLIFGILSVVAAIVVRRYATPMNAPSDQPGLNERGSYYVGRVVVVEDAIQNGRGRVRLGDTLWSAKGPDAAIGTKVKIINLDGTLLIVEPFDP